MQCNSGVILKTSTGNWCSDSYWGQQGNTATRLYIDPERDTGVVYTP